jgi:hypothetical protein
VMIKHGKEYEKVFEYMSNISTTIAYPNPNLFAFL